eukprot:285970-Prorocentrum_lima.AAC.1
MAMVERRTMGVPSKTVASEPLTEVPGSGLAAQLQIWSRASRKRQSTMAVWVPNTPAAKGTS